MPTYPTITSVLPTRYLENEPEYMGLKTVYQDGGADFRTLADVAVRRWTIAYENLTTAEAAQFATLATDTKYSSKEGSLLTLTFTPRGESAVTVRIDEGGYQHSASKAWIHTVTMKLIKRP